MSSDRLGKRPSDPSLQASVVLLYPLLTGRSRVGLDLREYASVKLRKIAGSVWSSEEKRRDRYPPKFKFKC